MKTAGNLLDYVSIHEYYVPGAEQTPYLTCMMRTGLPEQTIQRTIDSIAKAGFGGGKVGIAFDEWNMRNWYHPGIGDYRRGAVMDYEGRRKNDTASIYNMSDAVFTACFLNTCLRHCDVVKMACFSPVVNTRGAVFVHDKGIVKRTTYHVFWMYTHLLQSNIVPLSVDCGSLSDGKNVVPVLDAVLTVSNDGKRRALAVVNKHPDKAVAVDVSAVAAGRDAPPYQATVLSGTSTDDYNDIGAENRVVPVNTSLPVKDGRITLMPHSLSVIELDEVGAKR